MEDLIKYSLSLYEEHKTLPIILVFLIEGFSDEEIKSKFKVNNNSFMMGKNLLMVLSMNILFKN